VDERLDAVRELWGTYREKGVEPAIALLDPEVEFVDHEGRAFRGHDGVRSFFAEFEQRGEVFRASPYSFELHEPDLLVIGHRRIRTKDQMRGRLPLLRAQLPRRPRVAHRGALEQGDRAP
jgi:hypothetical protein